MKKIIDFLKKYSNSIIVAWFVIIFTILLGVTIKAVINTDMQQQEQEYVTYNVIAAADETYILQECDDKEHYIEVDQSKMYGVGDTVLVSYSDDKITNIWLYIDC